ncbi:hypothetical protein FRB95_002106 [Tulasnella sp. JGI-2019a]|nr:hypothetical protein FRB95_002106 [Tulasnella sp. JGI-2019a]
MPKRPKTPPIRNPAKLVTVWNPWPADLRYDEKILDEKAAIKFVRWISTLAQDNGAVLTILYKPKASCVVIEISETFKAYEKLLGLHRWVDEIRQLDDYDRTGESKLYFTAAANSHELRKANWKEKVPDSMWLEDFDPMRNNLIKMSYPKPVWCDIPTKSVIVGDPNCYCRPLPYVYFPDEKREEEKAIEEAAVKLVNTPSHIPGTAAYFEARNLGLPKPNPKVINPHSSNKKQKAKPKTLNVGAASKKGLPSQFPKKEPPRDFFPQEQALRQVLGDGTPATPIPGTSPDLDESSNSSTSEPLDWAAEMDREDQEKEALEQEAAANAPTWGAAPTWPGWDEDSDEEGENPYASKSAARDFAYTADSNLPSKAPARAVGWGDVVPSWDTESVTPEPSVWDSASAPAPSPSPPPVKIANAPSGGGNIWKKPAPPAAPKENAWTRNLPSSKSAPSTPVDADDGWTSVQPKTPASAKAKAPARGGGGGNRGGNRGGSGCGGRGGGQRGGPRKQVTT